MLCSVNDGDSLLLYRKEDHIWEFRWKYRGDAGDIGVLGWEGFNINDRSSKDGLREQGIWKNGKEWCEV